MTARTIDANGWFEVARNPISRVGVFPYMGRQLGLTGDDATKIFQVYRPASELSDPKAMDSFRLLPFIDDHTMLGDGEGLTPAEDKGVHGVFGDRVEFDAADGVLYSNVKVFSKALARRIDKEKKKDISCGYRCTYDFTPGSFNGQAYDAIQRNLRGNHGALVKEGRMGSSVAVLDHMTFTVDAKDLEPMRKTLFATAAAAALTAATAAKVPAEVLAAVQATVDAAEKDDPDGEAADAATKIKAAEDAKTAAEKVAADATAALDAANAEIVKLKAVKPTTAADGADTSALDAANEKIADLQKTVDAANAEIVKLKAAPPAMDEATIFGAIAARDKLADRLGPFIGSFDHADKTLAQVAAYGIEKLGLKNVTAGHELTALDAWLTGRDAPEPVTTAADAADLPKESAVKRFLTPA